MESNNILFGSKHYYLKILQYVESLRRVVEFRVLSGDDGKKQLAEIMLMWNRAFAGLLREGLSYTYVRNETDRMKDILRITINNIDYDANLAALYRLLGDEIYQITGLPDDGLACMDPDKEHNGDMDIPDTDKEKNLHGVKNLEETEKVIVKKEEKVQAAERTTEEKKRREEQDLHEPDKKVAEEMHKDISTFVYDEADIVIYQMGAKIGEHFRLSVMPLHISENDPHAEIAVAVRNDEGEMRYFSSGKTPSIIIDIWGYQLLVRGAFKEGRYTSYIIAAGNTAAAHCSINKRVTEYRSEDSALTNWGHIYFERHGKKFHAIPFQKEGAVCEKDAAGIIVCIEDENGYHVFGNPFVDSVTAALEDAVLKLVGYWIDNELIIDVFYYKDSNIIYN